MGPVSRINVMWRTISISVKVYPVIKPRLGHATNNYGPDGRGDAVKLINPMSPAYVPEHKSSVWIFEKIPTHVDR